MLLCHSRSEMDELYVAESYSAAWHPVHHLVTCTSLGMPAGLHKEQERRVHRVCARGPEEYAAGHGGPEGPHA